MKAAAMVVFLVACSSGESDLDEATLPDAGRVGDKLDVAMPGVSAEGYTIYEPSELQNDPRAGEPSYIYLDYGVDAVRLPGPTFAMEATAQGDIYVAQDANVSSYLWGTEAYQDGMRISINDRLRFDMKIEDFENEITPLAVVEMTYWQGQVTTSFIMLGNGTDGVAHRVVTTAFIDDVSVGTPSGPHTIELRGHPF